MYYDVTMRHIHVTIVAMEKQLSVTYCVCVCVPLVIQHAMRMRRVILSSVTCPAVQNLSTLSQNRRDFRREKSYRTQNVCFGFLCNFCLNHFPF